MIYAKGNTPIMYFEGATDELFDEIRKVVGVLGVVGDEDKAYVIFHPEGNEFEIEYDIKELINNKNG